jgi:hypothetical protein
MYLCKTTLAICGLLSLVLGLTGRNEFYTAGLVVCCLSLAVKSRPIR